MFRVAAILAHVVSREVVDDWIKFTINVISSYPRGTADRGRRGETFLWIPQDDLKCKCLKIRTNRRYFLVAKHRKGDNRTGYIIDRKSKVVRWKDKWNRRLKRFLQQEKSGECRT